MNKFPSINIDPSLSEDTTVVLSGATGFLGSTVLCALLHKIKADVVLPARGKNGFSAYDRVQTVLRTAPVFGPLKRKQNQDNALINDRIMVVSVGCNGDKNIGVDSDEWVAAVDWINGKKKKKGVARHLTVIHYSLSLQFDAPLVDLF